MVKQVDLVSEYDEGVVCYIDILGFGKFSCDKDNFKKIKNIFSTNETIKNMQKNNNFIGKVLQISDSIFITAKLNDFKEAAFFTSLLSLICLIRESVVNEVGTDIRCGITYGDFVHLDNGTIFGPAVTRAVLLEELKVDDEELLKTLHDHPAMILIDNNFLKSQLNKYNELSDFVFRKEFKRFRNLVNGYYLVNPFYFIYEIKKYSAILWHEEIHKDFLVKDWNDKIGRNINHLEKYWLTKEFLSLFSKDKDEV